MRIRTTEKSHVFSEQLSRALGIHDLQGLTLDSKGHFSAGVEAVEYEATEKKDFLTLFSEHEWGCKWALCNSISVPLLLLVYVRGSTAIEVLTVSSDSGGLGFRPYKTLKLDEFCEWWASLKGTIQTKKLYEAEKRMSFFDQELAKCGLSWGGNIDGFLLDSKFIPRAIIENRFTTKTQLERYDPAVYFNYRSGDYKTWEPLVLLASSLSIPLFLTTFERDSLARRIGFSVVDSISASGLQYRDGPPCDHLIYEMDEIWKKVSEELSQGPPYLRR